MAAVGAADRSQHLSSAVPALTPIAISLQAGFMEECVFRAVPLALGALIGERYGRRRLGIAIAFVLQALVFGAAHANYPGLSVVFAAGRADAAVDVVGARSSCATASCRHLLHALFDLVLISIPLFLVDAPGAWLQRALVIAAGSCRLAVVLGGGCSNGAWSALPDSAAQRRVAARRVRAAAAQRSATRGARC